MVTFNIPRGSTAPALEVAFKAANSEDTYWDATDDHPSGVETETPGINSVKFTMRSTDPNNTSPLILDGATADSKQVSGKTILFYSWKDGDTALATSEDYPNQGEFEVFYDKIGAPGTDGLKRTFPATPGDEIIINITEDLNGG